MIDKIKLNKSRRLEITIILAFALGISGVLDVRSQTNKTSGTNSAFTSSREQRDPFWPIGFVPKGAVQENEIKKLAHNKNTSWKEAMTQIAIQGVSSRAGNDFYAVINGQIKTVGETVSVSVSGTLYTWMVDSIAPPRSVKLRRVSAQ